MPKIGKAKKRDKKRHDNRYAPKRSRSLEHIINSKNKRHKEGRNL